MSPADWKYDSAAASREPFPTTHWNVVLLAGEAASPRAAEALDALCQIYWYPLYAYLRRLGYSPQNARETAQGFFARLHEKNGLQSVDCGKGKLRCFLLASLNHFLANERGRANPVALNGAPAPVSVHGQDAENRYLNEAPSELTPERLFERQWAVAVLDRALGRLRDEFGASGKSRDFALLKPFLTSEAAESAYGPVAQELNLSAGSITLAAQRMRQRYQQLVRAEIADTVASTADIDDEMRWLRTAFG
jgi:RNA polymerase sigma-70 factor (ECF subfamily)